jgi:hypothetical protein
MKNNFSDNHNNLKSKSLPKNWELPERWREDTLGLGLSNKQIDVMEKRFKDYWLCNQEINSNWKIVWEEWIMRMMILGNIKVV